MQIDIPISAETEAKLRKRAEFAGVDFETCSAASSRKSPRGPSRRCGAPAA